MILFDDLGYGDLSCYGNQLIETPCIDSIASHSVKMTNFYSSSPVCTPSRVGLLTGRLPLRAKAGDHVYMPEGHVGSKFRKFMGKANELPRDEILLPEIFKAAGYQTGMLGKWHLGDVKGHLPNDFGFDSYYGVRYSNDMLPLHIYRNEVIEEEDKTKLVSGASSYFDPESPLKIAGIDQTQLTEKYTKEAVKFISKHKDKPFFLYFAHSFPHVPHFASKNNSGQSRGGLYGDVVEDLDRSVQTVMEAIADNGLEENTLVFITSDNGADYNGSSGGLRGRKTQSYDGGQKVPMIVSWKNNLPRGLVTGEMSMNIDVFPTILNLLDLPLPKDREIDGKDIMPVLKGKNSPHQELYYTSAWTGEVKGIRNKSYKYHTGGFNAVPVFKGFGMVQTVKPQLSDMLLDNESHNLIKKYPAIAKKMKEKLDRKTEALKLNPRGWIGK
ncbi:sulfatase-like hydrolase/transferase [Tamlana sp. 2201CG12-4]|uniref:sulfatase-like hydrolase/transferase n=1 Tax=Tamlana sp. 2201CG12-4 TaxID=3112582 RepID=UPI002DB6A869|nr:sulfatase-like hydrolase/transferase [Tamlana sp. 2201CG12-4]MEC3907540.1 sulfatase-like hydrolase/transferase [Tamlana sp. 2201CG12-4]